ncbi:uncharacterized protein KGF55_004329 [Candida pseudojiufengensis]|uniref:uncharacterized protein n=1 Tax=Candida pseudojiufengensis TaxID=497109 RepID=UPI00222501E7|nr:uncharacterized protein KGF55_004329 [Candida pseudojiufengensis]KAI5960759.1 hypothetical protein KGF55_004329 [Candida pseudojiufengensis]
MDQRLTVYDDQTDLLESRVKSNYNKNGSNRYIISLAGVPGAGKTTFANKIASIFNRDIAKTIVISQDGYHLYRSELLSLPNPEEAVRRRGAPFTFNVQAFVNLVSKLKDKSEVRKVPSFDHKLKDPVEENIIIDTDVSIIILEGNYVSLKDEHWDDISSYVDDTWFISTPEDLVRSRIIKRHLDSGIALDEEEAIERADGSDLQNAKYIIENSKLTNVLVLTR